jgi:hypothetical protein
MPIIPSNWTGSAAVNAIGIGGGSGSTSYAYANSLNATITELDTFIDLVGVCDEPISREVSLDLISGKVKLYWKGLDDSYTQIQIFTRQSGDALVFNSGYNFVDLTLGQLGLSIKCSEITEISLVLRWDKDIEFDLYSEPVPPTPLITVIDNTFYVDQSQVINYPDPVTCYAYFVDAPILTHKPYQYIYISDANGNRLSDTWIINSDPNDNNTDEIYPTINDKFTFSFLPSDITTTGNNFYRLWNVPDWKSEDEQLSIISYNDSTKTFILGLITA